MDAGMVLIRHSEPSELDMAPYGTVCKVIDRHSKFYDIYLQVGYNEDEPHWELLGNFCENTHQDLLKTLIESRIRKHSLSD